MNKNTLLYVGLIIFGLAGAFIFPAYKLQMSFLYILIVLAMTWDVQGGQMGYNTFGNILFFGVGMYVASSTQIAMFFSLAEWTDAGGEKTFVHTVPQFFQGFGVGILLAGIIPTIIAGVIGYGILGLSTQVVALTTDFLNKPSEQPSVLFKIFAIMFLLCTLAGLGWSIYGIELFFTEPIW